MRLTVFSNGSRYRHEIWRTDAGCDCLCSQKISHESLEPFRNGVVRTGQPKIRLRVTGEKCIHLNNFRTPRPICSKLYGQTVPARHRCSESLKAIGPGVRELRPKHAKPTFVCGSPLSSENASTRITFERLDRSSSNFYRSLYSRDTAAPKV